MEKCLGVGVGRGFLDPLREKKRRLGRGRGGVRYLLAAAASTAAATATSTAEGGGGGGRCCHLEGPLFFPFSCEYFDIFRVFSSLLRLVCVRTIFDSERDCVRSCHFDLGLVGLGFVNLFFQNYTTSGLCSGPTHLCSNRKDDPNKKHEEDPKCRRWG